MRALYPTAIVKQLQFGQNPPVFMGRGLYLLRYEKNCFCCRNIHSLSWTKSVYQRKKKYNGPSYLLSAVVV